MKLTLVFISLSTIFGISTLDFKEHTDNSGLIFETLSKARVSYDSYTVLYHINIPNLREERIRMEIFLSQIQSVCVKIHDDSCNAIINQLKLHIEYMKWDELDIEAYQLRPDIRKKRAIEWVGSFYHCPFGLMDAESAKEYNDRINFLQSDTHRFRELLEEHTILIREEISFTNKTISNIDYQLDKIRKYRENTEKI